ncbi:DsbA family protein [Thalassovita taeanensis]|uniref:Protein-disulfide isomerase n=1 Tax=Thalassovita taeanensis TaxID=657014 RepID=A0A1H8YS73_9RHOB|nr:DsbA family protein [Thalassovita taeanensis]SEP54987.1 Protein-disulfide isomerase [Thalassovita taeanensis]
MKHVLSAAAFAAFAIAAPAQAFDLTAMSASERTTLHSEIRAYLLENPEVIMEAVQVLEERQANQQAQSDEDMVKTNADALFNDGYSWVGGNPDGDVTLVEFTDYRCGYCRKAHAEISELVSSDGNIRFILKEFPILGDESTLSSRFAIATRLVAGADAYKTAHDALITFKGNVTPKSLSRLADKLGLDGTAILARMNSAEVEQEIAANHALAGRMQISGTPTFILDGQMLRGYVPLASMQQLVAATRAAN